jgi:hypothetical protein
LLLQRISANGNTFLEDLTMIDRRSCSVAIDLASNQVQRIPTAQVMGLYLKYLALQGKITRFKMFFPLMRFFQLRWRLFPFLLPHFPEQDFPK